MPQGKLKAKAKLPASVAKKKAKAAKGPAISRKSECFPLFHCSMQVVLPVSFIVKLAIATICDLGSDLTLANRCKMKIIT